MKPKRIFLVRHGESEANKDNSVRRRKPDYAMELTDKGRKEAYSAGQDFKNEIRAESIFFYVSPYWRTRETFEEIIKHFKGNKITWREEPRLREQERGHLRNKEDGESVEEERESFGTFYFRIPDGESCADVYDRVSDFFGTMYRDFEKENFPDNVIIVTHGMTIRVFLMRWFHWTVEQFEEYANPKNCQIVKLEKSSNEKYVLVTELEKEKVQHSYQRPINV